jgi:regulator of protease activity HflC (stomatin/prohibitin superfamily)
MKAERDKRAQILDAEGSRQARILDAEGQAEAVKLVADAERYKLEVEATGQGNAITTVYNAILNSNLDNRVIAIQYLDTLQKMANGTAAKVFIPYEATAILGALGGIQDMLQGANSSETAAAPVVAPTTLPPATPTTGRGGGR